MEALFQIVGCIVSAKPAARQIDDFVAQVRRERAVVLTKDAQSATFVRFSAPDAKLVALACEAVHGKVPSSLRFGFASGVKEPMRQGQDGLSISHRSIAQAGELAAGADAAQVLVTPQLALLLLESGYSVRSKEVALPDGRYVQACAVERCAEPPAGTGLPDRPAAERQVTDALGSIYRVLLSQAGEVARKQADLEARVDAALTRVPPAPGIAPEATVPGALAAEPDPEWVRMNDRLRSTDALAERVDNLHHLAAEVEHKLTEVLARRAEIESLRRQCDALGTQMADAQQRFDALAALQERLLPLAPQVAALAQSVDRSQGAFAAFEGRLNELDRGAEAVEQKIRSLADREALVQAVKAEVENIRSISQRSREDLQYVAEQRDAVSELRARIEELLGRVQDTGGRIEQIESRRQAVEEVHTRTSAITHMLGDINVNLEMLSEQRAVIDHVGDQLARLDFTVQEAQNTLRALQREREVAERIEQGIKALRARNAAPWRDAPAASPKLPRGEPSGP